MAAQNVTQAVRMSKYVLGVRWNPTRDTVAALVSYLLVVTGLFTAFQIFTTENVAGNFVSFGPVTLAGLGVGIPLLYTVLVRRRPASDVGITTRHLVPSIALGLVLGAYTYQNTLATTDLVWSSDLVPLVAMALAVGLFEAVFFRGWLQLRFEAAFGVIPALFLGAGCYSLYHIGYGMEPGELATLFVLGIVFAGVFRLTRNILVLWPFYTPVGGLYATMSDGLTMPFEATYGFLLTIALMAAIIGFAASGRKSTAKTAAMESRSAIYFLANAAIIRAVESTRPQGKRLFYDPIARSLLPPLWRSIFEVMRLPGVGAAILAVRERQTPGVMGNLLCRTRYIDDALRDALSEGVEQVVILGAGSDTRAYRTPGIEAVRVFEVDHPATQALKKAYLRKALGELPRHVSFVPVDFDRESLEDAMEAAGFRSGARTFFVWEGVTQYITADAADGTLRYVSSSAAAGSGIAFTYVRRGIIDGSDRSGLDQTIVSAVRRTGAEWVFGIDPEESAKYLAERGLRLVEQAGPAEYEARYLKPMGRRMNVYDGERTALARVGVS